MVKSYLLFSVLLIVLGLPKVIHCNATQDPGVDGSLYMDIADHVRRGHGLVTDVSLYHKGYKSLPHKSTIYPLWPLVLGQTPITGNLRLWGKSLSTGFYFLTLIFAFLWGRSFKTIILADKISVSPGILAMLMIGLNRAFFIETSRPMTEGLGYMLVFAYLWLLSVLRESKIKWIVLGTIASLCYLTRSQLILVPLCGLASIIISIVASNKRTDTLKSQWPYAVICALVFIAYAIYIRKVVGSISLATWLRFDLQRANSKLSPLKVLDMSDTLSDYIRVHVNATLSAFSWTWRYGYHRIFTGFQWALPTLLVVSAIHIARKKWSNIIQLSRNATKTILKHSTHNAYLFHLLFASTGLISIHLLHKNSYWLEWHFSERQGLTAIFAMFFSLIFTAKIGGKLGRWLCIILIIGSSLNGYTKIVQETFQQRKKNQHTSLDRQGAFARLAHELNKQKKELKRPLVIAMNTAPQRVAARSNAIQIHWLYDASTLQDLKLLKNKFHIDLLLFRKETHPIALKNKYFKNHFREIKPISDFRVFKPLKKKRKKSNNKKAQTNSPKMESR